ncbi:MAG: type VI secretion system tube protein Hcp [Ectothiorhodospiraceae bacterium]|nr:type VI secretion system tube protein Hcp [Ectothiorhodospiraceae bacterium]MCH8506696.1 type VI secretion system tube protein Hcp [Ectothiorhodospiraceae bacterium]
MSIFMRIPGIQGSVSSQAHKGWIAVDELEWCVARRVTCKPGSRGLREYSNAEISDLTLSRRIDIASPYLFLEA